MVLNIFSTSKFHISQNNEASLWCGPEQDCFLSSTPHITKVAEALRHPAPIIFLEPGVSIYVHKYKSLAEMDGSLCGLCSIPFITGPASWLLHRCSHPDLEAPPLLRGRGEWTPFITSVFRIWVFFLPHEPLSSYPQLHFGVWEEVCATIVPDTKEIFNWERKQKGMGSWKLNGNRELNSFCLFLFH